MTSKLLPNLLGINQNHLHEKPRFSPVTNAPAATSSCDVGVTFRVVVLCLRLAVFFGCVTPIVDFKLFNTFLGATELHLSRYFQI